MPGHRVLEDRIALITGASRGIGEAIAKAMASAGAEVILSARGLEALNRVAAEIADAGGKARVVQTDLGDEAQVYALAAESSDADILVNNAAGDERQTPVLAEDEEHWRRSYAINFWAPYLLTRELGRKMVERGRGCIINISSIIARHPTPTTGAYVSSKAALEALSRVTAMELAPMGVRCNVIAPGLIDTELTRPMLTGPLLEYVVGAIPVGRLGSVEEVAGVAVFLASDAASFVTGQIINTDGGQTAGDYGILSAIMKNLGG